jgi:hypothetical protein
MGFHLEAPLGVVTEDDGELVGIDDKHRMAGLERDRTGLRKYQRKYHKSRSPADIEVRNTHSNDIASRATRSIRSLATPTSPSVPSPYSSPRGYTRGWNLW